MRNIVLARHSKDNRADAKAANEEAFKDLLKTNRSTAMVNALKSVITLEPFAEFAKRVRLLASGGVETEGEEERMSRVRLQWQQGPA